MDVLARLVESWRQSGARVRPGVSAEDLAGFEERQRVLLPESVRRYFLAADGTGEDYDDSFCRFYPLGQVRPVSEELPDAPDRLEYPDCFVFAEWACWAWGYAFRLTGNPTQPAPVIRVEGGIRPGPEIAPSFEGFLELYLAQRGRAP